MSESRIFATVEEEAKGCTTCAQWHHHCQAECCKQFTLTLPEARELKKGDTVRFSKVLTSDKVWYYRLHNVKYAHGIIIITLDNFKVVGNALTVYGNCNALTEDLKCKYHGTEKQPKICSKPNINENKDLIGITVTDNCLYRWK